MRPPEREKPDGWTPPEREEEVCIGCGNTFDRHPDDPPACSQRCWSEYLDAEQ